ncbi:MAG: YoaK family protein [Nocardioidaceae bacterium]
MTTASHSYDPPGRERRRAAPVTVLVSLLCVTSGSIDAISFLALGEAFASVMTGNIVFLGMSAARQSGELALFCGTALAGYAIGGAFSSWAVARLARPGEARIWPVRVTIMLTAELVVLAGLGTVWMLCGGSPGHSGRLVLLALGAVSMGIQGAAVRAIGVTVSTTYLTGALTTLLEAVVTGRGFTHTERSAVSGLVSLFAGALLGAAALSALRPAAMFLPCAGVAVVVGISAAVHWRR